ncbi:hypothetical protein L0128_22060, partial [candidate division KSB1 bacterium]|nr:hypothetical protein [candidate division KSB1 bacterium]
QSELSVQWLDSLRENVNYLAFNEKIASVKSMSQRVKLADGATPFGRIYPNRHRHGEYEPAASIRKLGGGKIAGVYLNLGERYLNGKVTAARDFLESLVNELFPNPIVSVQGSHDVDVILNRIEGKLAVNLVNTAGPHNNSRIYVNDDIPPVGPLHVSVKLDKEPTNVALQPARPELKLEYTNGMLSVVVPRLDLHTIIVIEE